MLKKLLITLLIALNFYTQFCFPKLLANQNIRLSDLKNHQKVVDFTVEAVYEVDNQKPLGARFRHNQSGFVLDLLRLLPYYREFLVRALLFPLPCLWA